MTKFWRMRSWWFLAGIDVGLAIAVVIKRKLARLAGGCTCNHSPDMHGNAVGANAGCLVSDCPCQASYDAATAGGAR